jgi:hypothetical protein
LRAELRPRPRPLHRRCPRSNASRSRYRRRGAHRQLHQARRFSAPIRTLPMLRGWPQRQWRQDASNQIMTCAVHGEPDQERGTRQFFPGRKPDQLPLTQVEFLHLLRVVFPSGVGLTKGEAIGIEVGYIAGTAGRMPTVARFCLTPDYQAARDAICPYRPGEFGSAKGCLPMRTNMIDIRCHLASKPFGASSPSSSR